MECKQNCFQLILSNKGHAVEKSFSSSEMFASLGTYGRYYSNVCVKLFKGCVSAVQILNILTLYVHRHNLLKKKSGLTLSVCNVMQKSGMDAAPCSSKLLEVFSLCTKCCLQAEEDKKQAGFFPY